MDKRPGSQMQLRSGLLPTPLMRQIDPPITASLTIRDSSLIVTQNVVEGHYAYTSSIPFS